MSRAEISDSELLEMMRKASLRPSLQRLAVIGYVAAHRSHPTPEEIFTELAPKFPSLSRTTVYNSLHALVAAGLLRELDIDAGNRRYDLAPQKPHAHFVCRRCGAIHDMPMPAGVVFEPHDGFEADTIDIYIKGTCPSCK